MVRFRAIVIGIACAAGLSLAPLPGSIAHAQSGGACQLTGVANLTPGLGTASQSFTYSFSGTLSNCHSTVSAATGGTVFAGTSTTYGTEQTGSPTGTGSCGNSTTQGTAVALFNDGSTAVITYTTNGAGAAVVLQGSTSTGGVPNSVKYVQGTTTTTFTTSAQWANMSARAPLTFSPTTNAQNCAQTPVTSANINGAAVLAA
jgi:hypothetical protein